MPLGQWYVKNYGRLARVHPAETISFWVLEPITQEICALSYIFTVKGATSIPYISMYYVPWGSICSQYSPVFFQSKVS
jgi:hypothetical protein